jgi:hypothetical protein
MATSNASERSGGLQGVPALRAALEALLSTRQPQSALAADIASRANALRAASWHVVVRQVTEAITADVVPASALCSTFNRLADVSDAGEPPAPNTAGTERVDDFGRADGPQGRPGDVGLRRPLRPVEVTIEAPDAQTLRVIREIPPYALCQLEGRNGIGKTLAVRLLELVSGRQPYASMPNAWRTLKSQLHDTTIEVVGLEVGKLTFALNPELWPLRPGDSIGERLGTVWLNDEQISWARARELFEVVRVAGDESLIDALARELQERAQSALRLASLASPIIGDWDESLLELQEKTSISRAEFQLYLEAAVSGGEAASSASEAAANARDAAVRARQTHQRLELALRRRSWVPEFIRHLNALNDDLAANAAAQVSATEKLRAASLALGVDADRREQVERWERLRVLRRRALRRAKSDEDFVLTQLGESARPDYLELARMQVEAEQRLEEAKSKAAELGVTDAVRALGVAIEQPLRTAPATVLSQTVAVTSLAISGQDLLTGIRKRRADLDGRPTSAEAQAAKDGVDAAGRQVRLLNNLAGLIEVTDRKHGNLDEAEDALRTLLDNLQAESQQDYETSLDDLRQLQEDQAKLRQQRDMTRVDLAGLLGLAVPEQDVAVDSSEADSYDALAEQADEEALLAAETLTSFEADLAQSVQEEDRLGVPASGSEWSQLWIEASGSDQQQLAEFGVDIDVEVLREVPSSDVEDPLPVALDKAAADLQAAIMREQDAVVESEEASEVLTARTHVVSRTRQQLSDTAKGLVVSSSAWSDLWPGLERLLNAAGGSRETISALSADELAQEHLTISPPETTVLKWMELISWMCERIVSAATGVRDGMVSIAGFLEAQAEALSPRVRISHRDEPKLGLPTDYEDTTNLRRWAEDQLGLMLNDSTLRRELFDDAESVWLSLESATVAWAKPGTEGERRRPLEGFSSGEQVFAYTKARLEQLRTTARVSRHRIVILDEFGAFVARNRFAQLLEFVHRQALGPIADQIVVMLPLSADLANESYAAELLRGAADSERRSDLISRVRQVESRGYFAMPVEVRQSGGGAN